jgi:hypothetical protein
VTNPINKGKGAAHRWICGQATSWVSDECLYWPFSRVCGYGHFSHLGVQYYAHRYMCQLVHGPAPDADHEAAHSCGNGHTGCVSPKHVLWKTRSANQADRALHGTKSTGAIGKLTFEQAQEIRALKGVKKQRELAAEYGVSRANISLIQNDKHMRELRYGRPRAPR